MGNLREERILRSGSEPFPISIGALTAGASVTYDPETNTTLQAARKYLPLDFCEITNDDTMAVYLILNEVDKFYCPAGTIKAIKDKHIWRVAVQNLGASTLTADKVRLVLQRLPLTIDTYVRKVSLQGGRLW